MGADEEGTLARLKAIRRSLIDPSISQHRGQIVKTTGDGMLVEFASTLDAIRCAVEVQSAMSEKNGGVSQIDRIQFRIGIHVDDIITDDNDIFGDGVNIAARLEGICEPGGICMSGSAYDQVRNKLPIPFVDLGRQSLKNIARVVDVYGLTADKLMSPNNIKEPIAQPRRPMGERGTRPSLAVLAFDDMSNDPESERFCDGLVEEIIAALSKFRWLTVASRNSSFAFKGRSVDIRKVAQELGVQFVLEGSARKSTGRIRITAQLIEGKSGNHIWAEHYDGDCRLSFDVQDEIACDIVASLEYLLWIALARADSHQGPPDPRASPLRAAAWHVAECTHTSNRTAIACAATALEANPKSVAAYQYLANAYIAELFFGWAEDAQADIANLLEAGRRATALAPADHLSQGLFGLALSFGGNHDAALACVERALALNKNSANVLGPCGNVLSFSGDAREANKMLERKLRLTPGHYFRAGVLSQMALNLLRLGEPDRALPMAIEALSLKPEAPRCHIVNAAILVTLKRPEAAQAALAELHKLRADLSRAQIRTMFPLRDQTFPDHLAHIVGIL